MKLLHNKAHYLRFVRCAIYDDNFASDMYQQFKLIEAKLQVRWQLLPDLPPKDRSFMIDTAEYLADMYKLLDFAATIKEKKKKQT